jgi:Cadherin-like domain/Carbohydrate binding module (family 6)
MKSGLKLPQLAALVAALAATAATARAQIPAFPGAEGFGAYATGGRGGDVYTVTNLASSGAGSLNYGIQNAPATGRTIVFAVSGYIPIANSSDTGDKTVRLVQNKITIAGQTAPGDGIGLKDGRILMTGNNAVIRHLRVRHGKNGGAGDCINLDSSATNSIIDHVSLMFSTDENISFFNSSLDNFTMQYSTSSWGMERHNAGGLWDLVDGSCHHTLWAHHRTRNPKARPYGLLEWVNNVTFHWRTEGFIMGDSQSNVNWQANVRGCYFISIPDHQFAVDNTALSKARIGDNGLPNFGLYLDNCLHDSNNNGLLDGTNKGYSIVAGLAYPNAGSTPGTVSYTQAATPYTGATGTATINIDPPLTAYKKVISSSGPLRLDATYSGALRDELDSLLITSVENQQSILLAKDTPLDAYDTPSTGEAQLAAAPYNITNAGFGTLNSTAAPTDTDGDGMPDYFETALGWTPATKDNNTVLASSGGLVSSPTFLPTSTPAGYTRLEEYLHFMAIPHAAINRNITGAASTVTVDLRRYVRGFVKAPVTFAFSNISNGTVSLQSNGYTAVFTPTLNFSGRARFDFTVTDGDGSTWKQTLGVLVKTTPAVPVTAIPAVTIQAEAATYGGGTTIDSNNAGFTGTGFANMPVTGGYVQFSGISGGSSGGTATLSIRFALGVTTARVGKLLINGVSQNITFAPTGAWTTWTTMNVPVTLAAGTANIIRFETNGQDAGNIDQIAIVP